MVEEQNPVPTHNTLGEQPTSELRSSGFEMRSGSYSSRFINIERRLTGDRAFPSEDDVFYASTPRPTHWSIAWSDLMMTMFVLFLCMFVYKAANEEFLGGKKPEVIGGDTTDALQTSDAGNASLPFAPIYPGAPLITSGTIKKVEQVPIEKKAQPSPEPPEIRTTVREPQAVTDAVPSSPREEANSLNTSPPIASIAPIEAPDASAIAGKPDEDVVAPVTAGEAIPTENKIQPSPLTAEEPEPTLGPEQDMYRLSKDAVESGGLEDFAAIDLVPDQTMRIILTSDLLFDLGQSWLSEKAQRSLLKIGEIIRQTQYMINVVGHTDNIPMSSNRFASNWELSVARASTVARFLINELGMDPNQFVVSGYSSYRPMVPNTTAENRARNRRVEIIISKKLPPPLPVTTENLN